MPERSVLVFRKRLLPYSETFIAAQGYALRNFRPVFTGFQIDKRGLHHLKREDCMLMADGRMGAELGKLRTRWSGAPPRGWLDRLRATRPALIHAHFAADGCAALPLARALGVALVVTFHGHDIVGEGGEEKKLRELFRDMRAGIAVSDFIRRNLLAAGCPADKIVQHYIGIDLSAFTPERQDFAAPTVLFVGRLVEKKGCPHVLAAVAALQDEIPDLRLIMVGDGPLRAELEAQAASLKHCEFRGALPPAQVRELMRQAWVLCGPSITTRSGDAEGLGMVFLEAQASGLPVVGYRSGGIPEAVVDGRTALLADEGDTGSLTAHLRTLLRDGDLRQRFSRESIAHVREHFDIRLQTQRLEQLYDGWVCTAEHAKSAESKTK